MTSRSLFTTSYKWCFIIQLQSVTFSFCHPWWITNPLGKQIIKILTFSVYYLIPHIFIFWIEKFSWYIKILCLQVAEKTALLRPIELKLVPVALEGSAFRSKFLDTDELMSYSSWFAVRNFWCFYPLSCMHVNHLDDSRGFCGFICFMKCLIFSNFFSYVV